MDGNKLMVSTVTFAVSDLMTPSSHWYNGVAAAVGGHFMPRFLSAGQV
jgi:hypothetical protein